MPLDPPPSMKQESTAWWAAYFNQQYPGKGAGAAYTAFANKAIANDPSTTPYVAAKAFLDSIMLEGLGQAIKSATEGIGQGTAKVPGALPGSIPAIPSVGGTGSDWQHLLLRFAEFGLGASIVIIGIAAIVAKTKGGQKVETIVTGAVTPAKAPVKAPVKAPAKAPANGNGVT